MITTDDIRKLEPTLQHASEKEVETIRRKLQELATLCIDCYLDENGSNFPLSSQDDFIEKK